MCLHTHGYPDRNKYKTFIDNKDKILPKHIPVSYTHLDVYKRQKQYCIVF